jgi:hypothetical protein
MMGYMSGGFDCALAIDVENNLCCVIFFVFMGLRRLAALGGGATFRGSLTLGPALAALRAGLAAKAATATHR